MLSKKSAKAKAGISEKKINWGMTILGGSLQKGGSNLLLIMAAQIIILFQSLVQMKNQRIVN